MKDNEKFLKALGKNINRIRKEQDISFQEMSYRCDIEKANLVKLTRNGENVTANTLYKISKGLDVPLKIIFDFKY